MDVFARQARSVLLLISLSLSVLGYQKASPAEYWLAPTGQSNAGPGLAANSPAQSPQGLEAQYSLQPTSDTSEMETIALFAPAPTEYYLAPWGKDAGGQGLAASSPARTPQGLESLYSLPAGAHVWLRGGDYTGSDFTIRQGGAPGRPIAYEAVRGEAPRLVGGTLSIEAPYVEVNGLSIADCAGWGVQADLSPGLALRNLTVTNTGSHGIGIERSEGALIENCVIRNTLGFGIRLNVLTDDPEKTSPGIVVRNCDLEDLQDTGIYTETEGVVIQDCVIARTGLTAGTLNEHGIYCKSRNAHILRNRIEASQANGISMRNVGLVECNVLRANGKAGFMFFNDTDLTGGELVVQNNVIEGNVDSGIWVNGKSQAQNYVVKLLNNTINGPHTALHYEAFNGQLIVANNILSVSGSDAYDRLIWAQDIPTNYTERNNLHIHTGAFSTPYYWGGRLTYSQYLQASGQGSGDLTGQPGATFAGGGDYHLSPDSLAINHGWAEAYPPQDADGNQRMALPDIGAYEYVGHSAVEDWQMYQ
ncbi:MAG: right-handed parallel beta-helix repeat-containing protein [Candidatus Sumerlaeota bacterium]|nr:right-handed parallel beta-helix repeat-containing protein [Candidatus Sumerlaeota bacterium]